MSEKPDQKPALQLTRFEQSTGVAEGMDSLREMAESPKYKAAREIFELCRSLSTLLEPRSEFERKKAAIIAKYDVDETYISLILADIANLEAQLDSKKQELATLRQNLELARQTSEKIS